MGEQNVPFVWTIISMALSNLFSGSISGLRTSKNFVKPNRLRPSFAALTKAMHSSAVVDDRKVALCLEGRLIRYASSANSQAVEGELSRLYVGHCQQSPDQSVVMSLAIAVIDKNIFRVGKC